MNLTYLLAKWSDLENLEEANLKTKLEEHFNIAWLNYSDTRATISENKEYITASLGTNFFKLELVQQKPLSPIKKYSGVKLTIDREEKNLDIEASSNLLYIMGEDKKEKFEWNAVATLIDTELKVKLKEIFNLNWLVNRDTIASVNDTKESIIAEYETNTLKLTLEYEKGAGEYSMAKAVIDTKESTEPKKFTYEIERKDSRKINIMEYGTNPQSDKTFKTLFTNAALRKEIKIGSFGGPGGGDQDIWQINPFRVDHTNIKYVRRLKAQYGLIGAETSNAIIALEVEYEEPGFNKTGKYGFPLNSPKIIDAKNKTDQQLIDEYSERNWSDKESTSSWECIEFDEDEYCPKIIITKVLDTDPNNKWPNNEFIRSIYIETEKGRAFSIGNPEPDDEFEKIRSIEFDGIIKDLRIKSGAAIDSLNFTVIQLPNNIDTFDYEYDDLNLSSWFTDIVICSQRFRNSGDTPLSTSFQGSRRLESVFEWRITTKIGISVTTKVKSGIPRLAEGQLEIGATMEFEVGFTGTNTEEYTYTWQAEFTVETGKEIQADVLDAHGNMNIPYRCKAIAYYRSGAVVKGHLYGKFKNASKHELSVELKPPKTIKDSDGYVEARKPLSIPPPLKSFN